jgi:hypothetical protein
MHLLQFRLDFKMTLIGIIISLHLETQKALNCKMRGGKAGKQLFIFPRASDTQLNDKTPSSHPAIYGTTAR